jgi:flagellar biosynthesis/type III secretory pathway protein FliH
VIDSQVKQQEHKMRQEMHSWMQQTHQQLAAEYEQRYLDAFKVGCAAGSQDGGANTAALPEMA